MTNKLISRTGMKNQMFLLNLSKNEKQLRFNPFSQNEFSYFIKMSLSPIIVAKTGDVN
jgi:hypothetical protein